MTYTESYVVVIIKLGGRWEENWLLVFDFSLKPPKNEKI